MKVLSKKMSVLALSVALATDSVGAQEEESGVKFNVQGDLVSSYVWRGMYQTGASVQPTLGLNVGGFSLTAWGSTDFDGISSSSSAAAKEVDLTAAYSLGNLTVSVADMWWAGQGAGKYFNFKSHETNHHFEAGLAYSLPCERFPLSVAWYTLFAGEDKKDLVLNAAGEVTDSRQAYSSYAELNYPFAVKGVGLNATLGFVPYESALYGVNGFAVTNIALRGTKEIQITDSFSLPLFAQVIWNPRLEDVHLVLGLTLR